MCSIRSADFQSAFSLTATAMPRASRSKVRFAPPMTSQAKDISTQSRKVATTPRWESHFAVLYRKVAHFWQSFSASVFSVCSCSISLVAAGRAVPLRLCVKSAGPSTSAGPSEDKTEGRQSAMDGAPVFIPLPSRPVRPIVTRMRLAYKLKGSRGKCKKMCCVSDGEGKGRAGSPPCAP